ncbi:MAG: carboxypeptidase regulatory-like domain-containing protein [Acidobacteriota bacterium]|nr:MAG: carboxypeptidase regulatory-like domain-containing protein [Acidobacteriota bacterium]
MGFRVMQKNADPNANYRQHPEWKKWLVRGGFAVAISLALFYSAGSQSSSSLEVQIVEAETGQQTPVRVRVTDSQGNPLTAPAAALAVPGSLVGLPEDALAVMYGRSDRAEGFARLPEGAFYVPGRFEMALPPGEYRLEISKGYEYRKVASSITLQEGEVRSETVQLQRWIDMPSRGWYSADDHIHLRRSPREDPIIAQWLAAEDIYVGNLLQMGDFWALYYSQYGWGESGRYRQGDRIISPGQEDPRSPEIGHTISLAANRFVRFGGKDYYRYDKVFDGVHEAGGVSGYAHQGMSFHGYRGMAMDVPEQKIDFLELLQFCVEGGPLHLEHFYHYLDLGFQLTATAGSDFPWCGRGPGFGVESGCTQIGDARFYTFVDGEFSFEAWFEGLKEGHTFVTSGPMLEFTVNDSLPGSRVSVSSGSVLKIRARALGRKGQIPLSKLEVVGHGKVLKSVSAATDRDREELVIEFDLPANQGLWIAARCDAGLTQTAHTTPVYISVDGKGFHNPETASHYIELTESYLKEIESELDNPSEWPDHRIQYSSETVRERLTRVRLRLLELRTELGI